VWPWEHAALGYLLYSVPARLLASGVAARGERPWGERLAPAALAALAVGTQAPDLVDKPLAWSVGALPSGTSLAHSVLVALPVTLLAVVAGRRRDSAAGVAFAVGYWSHLLGDVVYPVAVGGGLAPGAVLWPLVRGPADPPVGLFARTGDLLGALAETLAGPRGRRYLAGEAVLLGGAALAWLVDGAPGTGLLRARLGRGAD
jgi:hypothetical protein